MLRADITLKNATRIPLLGVKTEPSPYVLAKFNIGLLNVSHQPLLPRSQSILKTLYGIIILQLKPRS